MKKLEELELPNKFVLKGKTAGIAASKVLIYLRKKYVGNSVFSMGSVDTSKMTDQEAAMITAIKNIKDPKLAEEVQLVFSSIADGNKKISEIEKKYSSINEKIDKNSDDFISLDKLDQAYNEITLKTQENTSKLLGILIKANKESESSNIDNEEYKIEVLDSLAGPLGVEPDYLHYLDQPLKEELIEAVYNETKNGMVKMAGSDDDMFQTFFTQTPQQLDGEISQEN